MTTARTAFRIAAALGATTALTLAGAGAALATTSQTDRIDDTVSVTFTLEEGETSDTCGAVLLPAEAGLSALENLDTENTNVDDLLSTIDAFQGVIGLKNGSDYTVSLDSKSPTGTVSAENVPSGLYVLGAFCTSDLGGIDDLTDLIDNVDPILVGSPLDAISGLSSGGGLNALSSMVGGAEGEGTIGLDTLSAGLGGEADADPAVVTGN